MSYSINEIVITPVGRGVVTENLNDEVVSVKIDGNGEDRFRVDEVSYKTLAGYEPTEFSITGPKGMLPVKVTPIGYLENGIHKMKFEIKDAFEINKVYRNREGKWRLGQGHMQAEYVRQVGTKLQEIYNT
jgi:hypothetical protein